MKGNLYTLCYATLLGTVCALMLTAMANFTQPYKDANEKVDEILNILTALGVPLEADVSPTQMGEIFKANVEEEIKGENTFYVYSPSGSEGKVEAVAVAFSGPGLWGIIKGFLALEPDRRTIKGITFHKHEETPGLGGEIETAWFRGQFVGKSIVDKSGKAGIVIRSGGGEKSNEVDGITGATMTCDKVQAMLNNVIKTIVEEQN